MANPKGEKPRGKKEKEVQVTQRSSISKNLARRDTEKDEKTRRVGRHWSAVLANGKGFRGLNQSPKIDKGEGASKKEKRSGEKRNGRKKNFNPRGGGSSQKGKGPFRRSTNSGKTKIKGGDKDKRK